MKAFARLYAELDASTSTSAKVAAMRRYLADVAIAAPADAAWAVYFLAGGKPRQAVPSRVLRAFALAASDIADWLFEESYQAVGDLAETIAYLLPPPSRSTTAGLATWIDERIQPLRTLPPEAAITRLRELTDELDTAERFLLFKLIGGGFRVGVSRLLVTRALAEHAGLDPKIVAQRMVGATGTSFVPSAAWLQGLLTASVPAATDLLTPAAALGLPYPFFLAHQLDDDVHALGEPADWIVEWKYDGIRAQVVRRSGQTLLWSRGEELITERFPEIVAAAQHLPDGTVLDGELLVWPADADRPAPFAQLQTRITRKTVGPKLLRDTPCRFIAYDLLEDAAIDLRAQPQHARRALLEARLAGTDPRLGLSPRLDEATWNAFAVRRAESRARGVEGLMLKHRSAQYGVGRTRDVGIWWKWKIDPMMVDAVLVYAQRGHGRRASLYTDYTFAVWDRAPIDAAEVKAVCDAIAAGVTAGAVADAVDADAAAAPPSPDPVVVDAATTAVVTARPLPRLVAFAKAYSGLTDAEIKQVDAVIRADTVEKFGPVRSVVPRLVFELGFEAIARSPRHKSGIAVRFPRILRWRIDKPLEQADTLASLEALLLLSPP